MLVSDFDYHLPDELIAQEALADRAASRMLHLSRASQSWHDRQFRDLPDLLRPDDLLVFNNTRVFPARLFGHRSGTRSQPVSPHNPAAREFLKGKVEALLTSPVSQEPATGNQQPVWNALVRPGRKIGVGERLTFSDELHAEVIARGEFGERTLRFDPLPDFFAAVERVGHVPLPPYIGRQDRPSDRERYQTVYAREQGSVAAPTAGLHFTPEILDRIRSRGIDSTEVTLHVGLGTFQPVHVEKVEEHRMHGEWYSIGEVAARKVNAALAAGRRIVAIGTTTIRTLEYAASLASGAPHIAPDCDSAHASTPARCVGAGAGQADIFIYPGFQFRVVGAMLTNFHLPKSTLLMLVSAFAGREFALDAYLHAVAEKYRFYSYGDCMFIE
ncbi:MAG: tRNA preQ1(34) S-adenosylmethionine ribosyltransferase-isomerase QueA [Terriglobales bacterium]